MRGQKVIIYGGYLPSTFLIADMEIRPLMGWPKQASYGDSGVENDVFEASLLAGFGTEFSVFLRPAYYRGKQRTGRPGTREKEIGFEKERKREREKDTRVSKTASARAAVW